MPLLPPLFAIILALSAASFAQPAEPKTAPSALLKTLAAELDRNFTSLKEKGDPPPYFLSYTVTELETQAVAASQGALDSDDRNLNRFLDVSLRVGTPQLDNYHMLRGSPPRFASGAGVPLNDATEALNRRLWLETDRVYRSAVERLIKVKSSQKTEAEQEDKSGDFSPAPPETASELPAKLKFDRAVWAEKARKWSALLGSKAGVLRAQVAVVVQREVRYFVNSEGTKIEHGGLRARILISARGKATDGMELTASDSFESSDPARMPADKTVLAAVEKVQRDLTGLLRAPLVDPFVGPAILSGRAAGVFFHEIFGHRIEGHRQKEDTEGQTFAKKIDTPVLPEFLSVTFDPTAKTYGTTDLNGFYRFDDEGVRAQKVPLVEKGVLKTFLLSRSPVRGINASNGHGRKQAGAEVVARQSNLIVESTQKVPFKRLREMLLEELKKRSKPYGLYFEQVTGGFTTTGRSGLQAFTVIPLVVYRIWADGRPDELVRGADIVGTPLSSFTKITATSDIAGIFNGYCGAESGSVPVSAVSPALLVSEIEVQKKPRASDSPPFLTRPVETSEVR